MIIVIKPLDTLFFKDGKPFSMGEETWADTIFPPFPSTIYGALRTAWFKQNIKEFEILKESEKLNTEEDPTIRLKIKNIAIKKGSDFLFPIPRDILQNKDQELKRLNLSQKKYLTSAGNTNLLLNPTEEVYSYESSWIYEVDLMDYLNNDISSFEKPIKIEELFEFEPKIGIARNRITHSSEEGKLYRVSMLRLKEDIRIYVDFEGLDINKDFFKLGGEGKFVIASKIDKRPNISLPYITDNRFLLYLSTPAIFNKGWVPDWIDENTLTGTIPETNIQIKILTAAIGRPKFIGGFDMAQGKPKPMYKAVPEGSVYYFEILSGNKDKLKKIHGKSISDIYPEQGFGICYVGKY